jgi:quinol monooxygenase YgiN
LDAVAATPGKVSADVTRELVQGRQVVLEAVAATQGNISADVTRELAQGRQVVLDAFSDARATGNKVILDAFSGARKEIAAQVVQEVSAKLPPPAKEGLAADAQVKAVEHVGQALRDAVATLAQDVHDVKVGQGQVAAAVGDTVAPLTRQVQQLSEEVQSLGKTLAEAAAKAPAQAPGPKVERVYVEAEAVEVIPPLPQPSAPHEARAKPKAPSSPKAAAKAADLPPGMNGAGGLSMAELEQQAQRELERLGAQGVNLFKRTK